VIREKSTSQQQVDRQPGTARHQGCNQDGQKAAIAALYGSGCHNGGHATTETHDERYERLAVQAHFVHQFIHDKGCPGHIACVFHQGDKKEKDENVG